MRSFLAGVVCSFACTSVAVGQTIMGTVVDSAADRRVAAAEVVLLQQGGHATALTDSAGTFQFAARAGIFALRIRALGYADILTPPLTLGEADTLRVSVLVSAAPVALSPVDARARRNPPVTGLAGFHERMKSGAFRGFAHFIDSTTLERYPRAYVTDVLKWVPFADVSSSTVSLRPHCSDAIYIVDGVPIVPQGGIATLDGAGSIRSALTATSIVNGFVSPSDIAGIEVYRGDVGLPAELLPNMAYASAGSGVCGVIAIWTRR